MRIASWLALAACALLASAAVAGPPAVPAPLEAWRGWVLHGHEQAGCPWQVGQPAASSAARPCAWPGPLAIEADAAGARFTIDWQLFAESDVPLPGDQRLRPLAVRVDGREAVVRVARGQPLVRLGPGRHRIEGRFEWTRRPERLPVPAAAGLLSLRVDGSEVPLPERDERHLWLGRSQAPAVGEDSLSLDVYRLLADGVPQTLTTELQLEVSGRAREAVLGRMLPEGFVALALDSALPAALDPNGLLRVQLRPGSWTLRLQARGLEVADVHQPPANEPPWPAQEVWSFRAAPALRSLQPQGERPVDPQQVDAPWGGSLPSFVLGAGDRLLLDPHARGLDPTRPHRLRLQRDLWLDFNDGRAIARDRLDGELARPDRLDMQPPWLLERAVEDDNDLLVTAGSAAFSSGVELRRRHLALETLARRDHLGRGPVSGWAHDLESMSLRLHLPPGWRLLHADGADRSPQAWTAHWTLLDLFLLALATLLAHRVLGWRFAGVLALYLVVALHEPGAPLWTLLAALLAGLLIGWLPDQGRAARAVGLLRAVALLLAVLWMLPFAAVQLKLALYPQLERAGVLEADADTVSRYRDDYGHGRAVAEVRMEMAPPPAPRAPPAPMAADAAPQSLDRVEVTGSRITAADLAHAERYPTDAVVQAGPGVPDWSWQLARIDWDGPVAANQQGQLWLSPPWLTRTLRLLSVAALLLVLGWLLRALPAAHRAGGWPWRLRPVAAAWLPLLLVLPPAAAGAAEVPPQAMLDELRTRLLAPPRCAPDCASVGVAVLRIDGRRLQLALELHAATDAAVPLPDPGRTALVRSARLGTEPATLLLLDRQPWLRVPRGVHRVELEWTIASADGIELRFPLPPARFAAHLPGWELVGVQDGRLLGDTVQLRPAAGAPASAVAETTASHAAGGPGRPTAAQEFPPFVRITRTLRLGLDWSVDTVVERLAPARAGFTVAVPLLAGERVLDEQRERRDDTLLVAFAAGQNLVRWRSQLAPAAEFALTAGSLEHQAERWQVDVGLPWHVGFSGVPEIGGGDDGRRSFQPLPGETLTLAVHRPQALSGAAIAVDRAALHWRAGGQVADASLLLELRSTRGGAHLLTLPAEAELLGVALDGEALLLRLVDGRLALPLLPGEQTVELRWRQPQPSQWLLRTPELSLGASVANIGITVEPPPRRWLLATFGGGIGPAVLIWPQLVLMLLLAVGLARSAPTPLRTQHWLLLGLGFATVSWAAAIIVVGWLVLLGARARWAPRITAAPRWRFMLAQLGLLLLTIAAALALVVAIESGLLGRPDMQVVGNGSGADALHWFFDRSDGALPRVSVLTLPLWLYKVAILAWALWLANALIGWLRWAWASFSAGGAWPPKRLRHASPVAETASPASDAAVDAGDGTDSGR
jgi:hypothetical protein